MADTLARKTFFDPKLVSELFSKVKGRSSLAVLSKQEPIPFNGLKEFTFSMDSEIDIVAEGGAKSLGGISLNSRTIIPLKVEYGARVTDEFMYAADEEKIGILKSYNDGFAKKVAKGLDLMSFHGINPRTGEASAIIGNNCFDKAVTQTVTFTKDLAEESLEGAIAQVQGEDNEVNGAIVSVEVSSALAALKANGVRQYPDLRFGANPGSLNGLRFQINKTVKNEASKNIGLVGDFEDSYKWGYSKQIPLEVIEYGDPDNSGRDLKGHNEVYLRAEAYLGWGILDGSSFSRLVTE